MRSTQAGAAIATIVMIIALNAPGKRCGAQATPPVRAALEAVEAADARVASASAALQRAHDELSGSRVEVRNAEGATPLVDGDVAAAETKRDEALAAVVAARADLLGAEREQLRARGVLRGLLLGPPRTEVTLQEPYVSLQSGMSIAPRVDSETARSEAILLCAALAERADARWLRLRRRDRVLTILAAVTTATGLSITAFNSAYSPGDTPTTRQRRLTRRAGATGGLLTAAGASLLTLRITLDLDEEQVETRAQAATMGEAAVRMGLADSQGDETTFQSALAQCTSAEQAVARTGRTNDN